ncbi:hypothetical protein K6Q96_06755 [Grimontia kaedaensis]|uniref:SMI1/KNR4 family protein n=1 Tax=Grimontia kaedaensis TaxID=2872157 RepID=A0ABY4WXH3_9GAMM|nr:MULTISPECIES: hypothetical protein [Grimontia]USH03687.1 hypothetical protein K6Q96_06755 [Grimontia kaedaensis]
MKSNEYYLAEKYGLSYPKEYERYVCSHDGEFGELRWWFIGSSQGLFDVAYSLVNEDLSSRIQLFPFAKSSVTNTLACLDKNGTVYFIIGTSTLKDADWSKRLTTPNMAAWYQGVINGEF